MASTEFFKARNNRSMPPIISKLIS